MSIRISSRVVAEKLGKRHADAIKQINTILTNEDLRSLIISKENNSPQICGLLIKSEYKASRGRI